MRKKKRSSFESSIHVYRAMKRMTQQELAELVGVTCQTIIKLEKSEQNPSLLLAYNIATVLEVSIEKVFIFKSLIK